MKTNSGILKPYSEAADLSVDLASEFIFNKKLIDKAIDIIDRACAYNRIPSRSNRQILLDLMNP